jgi:hypothetical protein
MSTFVRGRNQFDLEREMVLQMKGGTLIDADVYEKMDEFRTYLRMAFDMDGKTKIITIPVDFKK